MRFSAFHEGCLSEHGCLVSSSRTADRERLPSEGRQWQTLLLLRPRREHLQGKSVAASANLEEKSGWASGWASGSASGWASG
eukprot:1700037-Pyramimonas_sp.AAC.1